jgi:hypothetical protein
MSVPVIEPPVVEAPKLYDGPCEDDDLAHWACCEDEEIAQCGVELSGQEPVPYVDDDQPIFVDCVTCLRLGGRTFEPCAGDYCHVSALRSLKGPKK